MGLAGGQEAISFSVFLEFESSLGQEFKLIFIIIIIHIISSISFVAFLDCHYLNPRISPAVHFSSPSRCRGRGEVSERLSSTQLPG